MIGMASLAHCFTFLAVFWARRWQVAMKGSLNLWLHILRLGDACWIQSCKHDCKYYVSTIQSFSEITPWSTSSMIFPCFEAWRVVQAGALTAYECSLFQDRGGAQLYASAVQVLPMFRLISDDSEAGAAWNPTDCVAMMSEVSRNFSVNLNSWIGLNEVQVSLSLTRKLLKVQDWEGVCQFNKFLWGVCVCCRGVSKLYWTSSAARGLLIKELFQVMWGFKPTS